MVVAAAGVQIEVMDTEVLVDWYRKAFQLEFTESGGAYYGQFAWGYQVAILPTKSPFQFKKNVSLVFRIENFSQYIETIKAAGVEPVDQISGGEGQFAFFTDPEGNRLVFWGS